MKRPTIHFAFTVPLGGNIFRRAIDKLIRILHLIPLHRLGYDFLIPWQHPIRSVHAISINLLHIFKAMGYPVRFYSFYEETVAKMKPGDIFIGQPLAGGGMGNERSDMDNLESVTSRTVREFPENKNFLIMPYSHDAKYVSWAKPIVSLNAKQGGGLVLVGGSQIWARDWESKSPFADLGFLNKLHVIMGIDQSEYPQVKKTFNEVGKRGYLYIGHTSWYKNTKELEKIAEKMKGYKFGHIGAGEIKGWEKIIDFASLTPEFVSNLAKDYDFFVSVSTADPGATTILEQMCFGFVVAATPETGYEHPSLIKLSTNDTDSNVRILESLQKAPTSELVEIAAKNRTISGTEHTWNQFCKAVTGFMNIS